MMKRIAIHTKFAITTNIRTNSIGMIKVGVFWASVLLNVDIILDIEEYPEDYQSKDMLLTYSKQHKDVWERLSKEQCGGKYSTYKFDAIPRGRVWYDLEEKAYKIVFYRGSKEFINTIAPKIKELFGIDEAVIVDDLGKRYRNVCEDCFVKYNCTRKK